MASSILTACADEADAVTTAETNRIWPEGLTVVERPGGCGGLVTSALSLVRAGAGLELYAAVENVSERPACAPALSVELFDRSSQSAGAAVGGLLVERFYRSTDGTDATAACLAPREKTMVALRDLNTDLGPDEVSRVEYWCNYWALDVVPLGEVEVEELQPVAHPHGSAFRGVLRNGLPEPLASAGVAVFPLDSAGRPLGVTFASAEVEVPVGRGWSFETGVVNTSWRELAAFPTRGP